MTVGNGKRKKNTALGTLKIIVISAEVMAMTILLSGTK